MTHCVILIGPEQIQLEVVCSLRCDSAKTNLPSSAERIALTRELKKHNATVRGVNLCEIEAYIRAKMKSAIEGHEDLYHADQTWVFAGAKTKELPGNKYMLHAIRATPANDALFANMHSVVRQFKSTGETTVIVSIEFSPKSLRDRLCLPVMLCTVKRLGEGSLFWQLDNELMRGIMTHVV